MRIVGVKKGRAASGCGSAMIGMFVTGPIWLVLLYKVLVATNADQLAWILFWIYVPAYVISHALSATFVALVDAD
jgi:hypothetical protein